MRMEEIVSVLSDLYRITGFRVSLHGADYSEIAAYPAEKQRLCRMIHEKGEELASCIACDRDACRRALTMKRAYIYKCRYGMTEAVSPLYNFGTLTGFLMMGQVVAEGDRDTLSATTEWLSPRDGLPEAIGGVPTVSEDMIGSYVRIMTICAEYLTLSNAIPSEKPTVAQLARKYILENFTEKIGIKEICNGVGCSKSTLVTAFKREYGTTVNAFLTAVRLEEALKMIRLGQMSVGEIASACGFSDQSYFSKVFSAHLGTPPSLYRHGAEE